MILVVGGHSRKVGKTSFITALIRALPEARWTVVKVTPHAHAEAAVFEETDPAADRDTARYLAAGAARALLVHRDAAHLLPALLASAANAIVESNSALQWLQPDLCVMVRDPSNPEYKESARAFQARADAVVTPGSPPAELIQRVRARLTRNAG